MPTEEDSHVSDDDREDDINGKVFGNSMAEEQSSCFDCTRNNKILSEMNRRTPSIEEMLTKLFSQYQDKLFAKIKQLEEERVRFLNSPQAMLSRFSFPEATIEDIQDFIKPVLKRKPQKLILHLGTNNLKIDKPKVTN